MSLLHTKVQFISGEYNFASDPNAGAVGNVNIGVHIPRFAMIWGFWANALVAPLSGGLATIAYSLNTTDTNPPVSFPAALMPATAIAGFVLNTPVMGVDLYANPFKTANTMDVIMNIGAFALTAGRLQVWVAYTENDL